MPPLGPLDPTLLRKLPDVHPTRDGALLRPLGWFEAVLRRGPEAYVAFDVAPEQVLGFDGPRLSMVGLARLWYRLKGRPGAGWGAFSDGARFYVLVDRRWCDPLGLDRQLCLRVKPASQAAPPSGSAVKRSTQPRDVRSTTLA